jgi:hypothetical protein
MAPFTQPYRLSAVSPRCVGVFEDDAFLLRLAARSRPAESARPCAASPIDSEDLAFDDGRLLASQAWDV